MLDPAIRKADYLLTIVLHYHDNHLLALQDKTTGIRGNNAQTVDDRFHRSGSAARVVWEQDLLRAPVNVLKDLKCVLTLLKGNIVYRDTQRLP